MSKDQTNKNDANGKAKKENDKLPFSEVTWDESNEKDDLDQPDEWNDTSTNAEIFGEEEDFGADFDSGQTDDRWKTTTSPFERRQKTVHTDSLANKKREFNPWIALDKASRKTVSRRDLLRGLFRFLPRKDDDK